MQPIPSQTQILVIGGGPSGSYAASALVREGFQVTLLEAAKFPRYHIGESLLPSMHAFLRFIGVLDKVKAAGFCPKPGAAAKFTKYKREAYTDFSNFEFDHGAFNVVRSQFDEILLRHAASEGVKVFEEVKVTSILFEDGDVSRRPIAAQYESKPSTSSEVQTGKIHFDFLVDASGRASIMSQQHLKNRHFNRNLDNVACWGYWTGCQRYSPGTSRENAVWVEALQDETGWVWFIPLHDGTVSVGVVQNQTVSANKKRALRARTENFSLKDHYLNELKLVPGVLKYIGDKGQLVEVGKDGGAGVKQAADYSYSAGSYAGPGFRLVGDASAFIDPFFSSGVHLALSSALSASATISSVIRGVASEEECAKWHESKVGTAYTRFLLVVLGAYKQMRSQADDVLSDVNEDNFDRAFDLIRPIIQGTADVGQKVTENEVQKSMSFLKNVFNPADPEMNDAVTACFDPDFFGPGKTAEEDPRHELAKQNAKKPVNDLYNPAKNFELEAFEGWSIKLQRGQLGMVRV